MHVLIVEDNPVLGSELLEGLKTQGLRSQIAANGQEALDLHGEVEAVLLDIGLPDMDGFEVCRRIRATSSVPIIMLSARGDEFDRVLALKLGADDYIVKPYSLRELAARIEAVIRRARGGRDMPPVSRVRRVVGGVGDVSDVRELRDMRIDVDCRRVTVQEREVYLTRKEFDFLALLSREPGKVFSREKIMTEVWGHDGYGDTRTLGVHVTSLRKKLGVPAMIETVRGVGFRLAM